MVNRSLKLNKSNSLFLFGARGTGKTTLINAQLSGGRVFKIDLLKEEDEELYRREPAQLSKLVDSNRYDWIVIDEIQKLPKLLDRIHYEIERSSVRFALTGSSARKLKRGAANLLAGRAFTHHLFPFTAQEMGKRFSLESALRFGSLPKLESIRDEESKCDYLNNYVSTYLAEEIVAEQIVRKIPPFRDFLKIAAQANGTLINYSKIGGDIGVDDKTVHSYFDILEDTLIGFHLRPFHRSIRKRQRAAPKFYLFDTGVRRALEKSLRVPLEPGTYAYGKAFEHRVILEAFWANSYGKLDYEFSYLRTKDDAEIDLIIERPGMPTALVEIKSSARIDSRELRPLLALAKDFKNSEAFCLSLDPRERKEDGITCMPWQRGLRELGL